MKNINILLLALLISGCTKETLEVKKPEDASTYPDFNFNIETVSVNDTIKPGSSITYNLYLRQQLTYVPGRKYYVSFKLPQTYDGEAQINGNSWRSQDLVMIEYDSVYRHHYRIKFIYKPLHQNPASYTLDFECKDETDKVKNFTKQITIK